MISDKKLKSVIQQLRSIYLEDKTYFHPDTFNLRLLKLLGTDKPDVFSSSLEKPYYTVYLGYTSNINKDIKIVVYYTSIGFISGGVANKITAAITTVKVY